MIPNYFAECAREEAFVDMADGLVHIAFVS
jgi:hypothetical protein